MARAMPESALNILASLISKPLYGYAIRKEVYERTHGEVDLTFGTLYEQIGKLLRQGFIELEHEEVSSGGKRRKFYKLTAQGAAVYRAQVTAMQQRALRFEAAGVNI